MSKSREASWAAKVSEWKSSGLNRKEFCSREKLNYGYFCQLIKKQSEKVGEVSFVELVAPETRAQSLTQVVIRLHEWQIELPPSLGVEFISGVIRGVCARRGHA